MFNIELMSQKYLPDPHKLAHHYRYNLPEIIEAFQAIRREGAGKHMHSGQLIEFEEKTLTLLENIPTSHRCTDGNG